MDLTEKILKLVSLGWDGKEELEVFFKEKYHLTYTHTSDYYDGGFDKFNIISIKYEDNTGDIHCLKVFRKILWHLQRLLQNLHRL